MTNGHPPQPVAVVTITMLSDGNIVCNCQTPNRNVFLMMLEAAKIDVMEQMRKKAEAMIQEAPPGLRFDPR